MVRGQRVRDGLTQRIHRLAPVMVYTESLEMAALAAGAYQVQAGKMQKQQIITV
jgi:butyrate kinase